MKPTTKRLFVYFTVVFGSLFAGAKCANLILRPDLSIPDLTVSRARKLSREPLELTHVCVEKSETK